MGTKTCKNCKKIFLKNPRFSKKQWMNTLYCSSKCSASVNGKKLSGRKHTEEHNRKIRESLKKVVHTEEWNRKVGIGNKGKVMSVESRRKMSEAMKGRPSWNKGKPGTNLGKKFDSKWRLSIVSGIKKHYDSVGRKSPESKRIRKSTEYSEWRTAVFSRDKWTCQECSIVGGELHPHHIKSFAKFPELRFVLENGLTLCPACHKKTDSYGKR